VDRRGLREWAQIFAILLSQEAARALVGNDEEADQFSTNLESRLERATHQVLTPKKCTVRTDPTQEKETQCAGVGIESQKQRCSQMSMGPSQSPAVEICV
jgi:hypothetical protein